MKCFMKAFGLSLFGLVLLFLIGNKNIMADTGWEGATRVEFGRSILTTQVTVATATASNATSLISASANRPCVLIKNLDSGFRVAIGSTTSVNLSNGYKLEVSTYPAGSSLLLFNFTGPLFGKGEGIGGGPNPAVSILECNSAP